MIEIESNSTEETMALAAAIATALRPGDTVTLTGDLGAGKTCFVRGLAHGLGLDAADVSSPTFVIVHEYRRRLSQPRHETAISIAFDTVLIHLDAYRLSGPDDLHSIGWSDLIANPNAVMAIEWPQRIAASLPPDRLDVTLSHLSPRRRSLILTPLGAMQHRAWELAFSDYVEGQ